MNHVAGLVFVFAGPEEQSRAVSGFSCGERRERVERRKRKKERRESETVWGKLVADQQRFGSKEKIPKLIYNKIKQDEA